MFDRIASHQGLTGMNARVSRKWRWVRRFGVVVAALIALPVCYFALSYLCLLFAKTPRLLASEQIVIAVIDNGVHADLVLPVRAFAHDWRAVFEMPAGVDPNANWIAIGWGQQEFYLNTPSWSELKLGTAWRAISGQGNTLLHVSYLTDSQLQGVGYRAQVDQQGFAALRDYIVRTAKLDQSNSRAQKIADGYDDHDSFFAALGSYNAWQTCNAWAGRALAAAAVKVSPWTPLPSQVSWYLAPATM
jgi:uncharacterized protein (TIGR02117 family)